MVRKDAAGAYSFYLPKRDLEDAIVSMEFDSSDTVCLLYTSRCV